MLDNRFSGISPKQLLENWRFCLQALVRAERLLRADGIPIPEGERNAALTQTTDASFAVSQPLPTVLFDLPPTEPAQPKTATLIRKACKALSDEGHSINKGAVEQALDRMFPDQECNHHTVASSLSKMEKRGELIRVKTGNGGVPHEYVLGPNFKTGKLDD